MIVIKKSFSQQIAGTFLSFKAGDVIDGNLPLEDELVKSGAPVERVKYTSDLIACPHCKRKFTIKQAVAEEAPKSRLKAEELNADV